MEEVDKIIIHSLHQIGCSFEEETINTFTPPLLVHVVSKCLQQIKPESDNLPISLPPSMAQRFTAASTLAEACSSCGYRSDIGYQTFLYPNAVEVRRLLMFLIEHLPKGTSQIASTKDGTKSELDVLLQEVKSKMLQELRKPWLPQYARRIGNQRYVGCSSETVAFKPHLNLNILNVGDAENQYQQIPSVFQQTSVGKGLDLIATVLHKNSKDIHEDFIPRINIKYALLGQNISPASNEISETPTSKTPKDEETEVKSSKRTMTPFELLNQKVLELKQQSDQLLMQRKSQAQNLNMLKLQTTQIQNEFKELKETNKMHERICLILENPSENIAKLEGLINTAKDKHSTVEQQWKSYRKPLVEKLEKLQESKQSKHHQYAMELRSNIIQLETTIQEKITQHSQLSKELQNLQKTSAPRQEYTKRILEFIGNIRKQRNDIDKILSDTRDLQKMLNNLNNQVQRQFSYTDDLLFQSAKHDLHAKRAYKLLAMLHSTCTDLLEMISQTGNVSKEIRDIETAIDRELLKNVASSLEQISMDIQSFETLIENLKIQIKKAEIITT